MKLPRDLRGSDLAKALCRDWGYRIVHQEGSHLILQTEIPSHQRIPIPDMAPPDTGSVLTRHYLRAHGFPCLLLAITRE